MSTDYKRRKLNEYEDRILKATTIEQRRPLLRKLETELGDIRDLPSDMRERYKILKDRATGAF